MEAGNINRSDLHKKLEQGVTVVTGNSRLSESLKQEFQQQAVARGLQVWDSPDIKPWNIWIRKIWEESVFDGLIESPELLLTEVQEQYVWESIIETSSASVLRKEATASKASEAWQQLINWQVDLDAIEFDVNEDTQTFKLWVEKYEQQCLEQGWLPASHIAEQLVQCFNHNQDAFNSHIILLGFDELTPLQQALYEAIANTRGSIQWLQLAHLDHESNSATRLACADNSDEIVMLSGWIRQRLEEQPDAHIGVVVPDLAEHRSQLLRCLTESLVPCNLMVEGDEPLPWNISLGLPLMHYPIIAAGFSVLELAGASFQLADLGPLIISPYLAGASEELTSRALLDRKLREIGAPSVSLKDLYRLADNTGQPWHSPQLTKRLHKLVELTKKVPGSATSADWVKWFTEILSVAGWAKDRDLNAAEYQAMEAFHKLMARFSGLQSVTERLSYSRALGMLKRLALSQIFQPRSDTAPVQILGLYEAIGMQFDALWVMDLHDSNWPSSPQPNPFIPLSLQRQLSMPHADQARELAIARRITQRLLSAAPEVVMSYPLRKGEEQLRISPLIMGLAEGDKESFTVGSKSTWSNIIQKSGQHELLADDVAPQLQQHAVSGGSGIFKYQSLCPFRAFAQYRLSASAMITPELGLDAKKRGQLFHRILELFWREARDLKTLLAMNEDTLENKLDAVIGQAIDGMAEHNPGIFSPRFRQIESSRLKQLTRQWLVIEKQRADFKVVDFEKEVRAEVNGIGVHLWIDRIDELVDGRKVVIDYKTGSVNPAQWFGDRPEDPQLPLYSIVEGEGICAVLFAQLKAAEMKFNGVVEEAGLLPDLPPPRNAQLKQVTEQWPQVLDDWKLTINKLAQDFRHGRAEVDPKKPSTCQTSYCELSGLCRIDEMTAGHPDE